MGWLDFHFALLSINIPCLTALRTFLVVTSFACSGTRARSAYKLLQSLNLFLLALDLGLLLFNRIEHGPQDRIVVDEQIALIILHDCFGNDLLHGLRAEAD